MPTKKTSGTKRRRTRAMPAIRTVTRRVRSGARSIRHKASGFGLDGAKPLTMLLFGIAGRMLGGAIDDSGLGSLMYRNSPQFRQLKDAAYTATGGHTTDGTAANKALGLAVLAHSLYESRHGTIKGGVLNAELPFAIGALSDPPGDGVTSQYPGSGGTQGYWVS